MQYKLEGSYEYCRFMQATNVYTAAAGKSWPFKPVKQSRHTHIRCDHYRLELGALGAFQLCFCVPLGTGNNYCVCST